MACEDFPCCGHEPGCCPDFDESGKQLNMKCVCGAVLPVNNPSSLCVSCLKDDDEDDGDWDYESEEDKRLWDEDDGAYPGGPADY